jgi:glutamate dehydrogenase/leucine dehydrogenase
MVGGTLAQILHADGHRVMGISDVNVALFNEKGLDIPTILDWRQRKRTLSGLDGDFEIITNEDLLTRPCDILVPCAVANAIHSRNADAVQARLIVEGAHGPISVRGNRRLDERSIPIVPDILANGGGVVLSYFEWVQGRIGYYWQEEIVRRRLIRFMREAWNAVLTVQVEHDVSLRMAAGILAVQRVCRADDSRGIYA